jgi:TldD protein
MGHPDHLILIRPTTYGAASRPAIPSAAMRDITNRALDTATALGATYADVRVVRHLEENITIKSGRVEGVAGGESEGFGVRVIVGGAWGFAASHHLTTAEADRVAAEAVRIARASATAIRTHVTLDGRPAAHGRFESPVVEDPFGVPLDRKIADLLAADGAMNAVRGIAWTETVYGAQREWKTFAASDGSYTEQVITHIGAGLEANAIGGDEHQRRSYPDNGGAWASAGYEYVRAMDLAGNAERVAAEAVELLSAPPLPAGTRTILLHPSQLYMQVHESCGHPTELDRAFGTEASYAGTSFLTPDMLGTFRYGSELCDIVADATVPGGLGSFGWDDEGVVAQRVPLIKEGIFTGYLSSRETAPRIGRASGGAMRADGWNRIPLIRMTNVNLLPKPGLSFDDIVADTDDGLLFDTNRSWSIDDRRLNFQFSTEICREIKGGKVGRLFRNGTYTGITYELWRSMDAVGDASSWRMWGTPTCGKGEPPQSGHVGHGVSGARFRNVRVGVVA